ncbi:MAG: M48 family metallopeptidase [Bacteroidales bacterium]
MQYVGIQSQIWKNNFRSVFLIISFPAVIVGMVWLFLFLVQRYASQTGIVNYAEIQEQFIQAVPFVLLAVGIWFAIAWLSHTRMIQKATLSKPLTRKENMRVYNLVENLCMSRGLPVPRLNIIEDDSLNAFASGISKKSYTISLSRGIISKLDDDELEAVIAHELTHIMNKDVRLLIISVIFVGIFAFISHIAFRSLLFSGAGRSQKKNGFILILILLAVGIIGYILSIVFRFALSRKREYLADAGAAELTKNPDALARALRKISKDPWIEAVKRDDVAQMFIDHPTKKEDSSSLNSMINGIFATHPPVQKRIQILEQF